MKFIQDIFTIIHIKISGIRIAGTSLRHFITGVFIFSLIVNTVNLFNSFQNEVLLPFKFLESSVLIILIIYISMYWLISWPKAGQMLNKASGYEAKYEKKK